MIAQAIHYEGCIHVQDELSEQIVRKVSDFNVINLEINYLLNQSRAVDFIEEDMNFILGCLRKSVEQVVDAFVTGNSLVVPVLVRCEVERIDGCSSQVVIRVNGVCVAILGVRALQAALVKLHGLHKLIEISCNLFEACIKTVLCNLVIGILEGSLVYRDLINLLDIDGCNDSVSLVEAIVATSVTELQLLGALLDTFELDGRLFVLSVDNAQLQTSEVGSVGVDGHVNLAGIVVLEHERNVGGVLKDINTIDHLHILLGEGLLRAYIITCARCGELNVLLGLAIVSNEDVGLNVEGQIQCAEGRIVCALDDDAGYLLCEELLNS